MSCDNLRVTSFNCHGFKSARKEVADMCRSNDLIFLQETWLAPYEVDLPACIASSHSAFSLSAINITEQVNVGRPYGGLSVLWSKRMGSNVRIRKFDDDRLLGLSVVIDDISILFISVYLPCNTPDRYDEHMNYVGKVTAIIEEANENNVCILGDFNAHVDSQLFRDWMVALAEIDVSFVDTDCLPQATFTHVNYNGNSRKWLDHICMSEALGACMSSCTIGDYVPSSDHLPLSFTILTKSLPQLIQTRGVPTIDWKFVNVLKSEHFVRNVNDYLAGLFFDPMDIDNDNCRGKIDGLYDSIQHAILNGGMQAFGEKNLIRSFRQVPGWNDYVAESHESARAAYVTWRDAGCPPAGPLADRKREARAAFKYDYRYCIRHEEQIRSQKMSQSLLNGEGKSFWKEFHKATPKSDQLAQTVGGVCGEANIVTMWKDNYESLLNCVNNDVNKEFVDTTLNAVHPGTVHDLVSVDDISKHLKSLKKKAPGCDNIPAEALKLAPPSLLLLLALFFTWCIKYSYVPEKVLRVSIKPLIKNKCKCPADIGNYRPIAKATALSKLLEIVLLHKLTPYLHTSDNQFGFKRELGTEMAVFTLKQVTQYYIARGSPVYLCFLDAKKAFDRVNHATLFKTMIERGTPLYLVKLLSVWYKNQRFMTEWGSAKSQCFSTSNGIRQGGILSTYLYNVYIDDLNRDLQAAPEGCRMGDVSLNTISYADDMVLIAPHLTALQRLLDICYNFSRRRDIVYNETKSVCMLLKPRNSRVNYLTDVKLGNTSLNYVDEFLYLGHIVSGDLSDAADIKKQIRRTYATGNQLVRSFSTAPVQVKCQLFRTYCYNQYANSLWSNYTLRTIAKVRVAYNDVFRNLMQVPRWTRASPIFVQNRVYSFKELLRKSAYSLQQRLYSSQNTLVQAVMIDEGCRVSPLRQRWERILTIGNGVDNRNAV